jgi:hypothetical protein
MTCLKQKRLTYCPDLSEQVELILKCLLIKKVHPIHLQARFQCQSERQSGAPSGAEWAPSQAGKAFTKAAVSWLLRPNPSPSKGSRGIWKIPRYLKIANECISSEYIKHKSTRWMAPTCNRPMETLLTNDKIRQLFVYLKFEYIYI